MCAYPTVDDSSSVRVLDEVVQKLLHALYCHHALHPLLITVADAVFSHHNPSTG